MSRKFKVIAAICAIVLAFGMVACGKKPTNPETPGSIYTPPVLETNGVPLGEYKVVIPAAAGSATRYAADELVAYIEAATDITLEVTDDSTAASEREILIGDVNRTLVDGVNFEGLGEESYSVKNIGDKLLIAANDSRGVLYGVYAFLEALGYRFFTADCEVIPDASKVFVPKEVSLEWSPTFEYREVMYYNTRDAEFAVKLNINSDFQRAELKNNSKYGGCTGFLGGNKYLVHTMQYFLPESIYKSAHPEYFATNPYDARYSQPCFTNFDTIDIVYDAAVQLINSDPKLNILSITQNDGDGYCQCEECLASYAQYGYSGTVLNYVNRVARKIKVSHPDILVDTLSYAWTRDLPKNGAVPDDNVCIRLCTRMSPFHTDENPSERLAEEQQRLTDWSEICDKIYIYCYPIVWPNLYASWPNYEQLRYDNSFYASHNVKGVYAEGYPYNSPEFGELKAYLMAKSLKNPSISKAEYNYHMNDFLQGYYGSGGTEIRKFIDLTYTKILEHFAVNGDKSNEMSVDDNFIFEYDESSGTYDLSWVNTCNSYWDNAERYADEVELPRIEKSRIHWTFIELCSTMENRYLNGTRAEMEELEERCAALYADIKKYDCTKYNDSINSLLPVTEFWQAPSPSTWFARAR